MLQENNSYIMKIIFDNEEFILPLAMGQNPKFNFDQIITKQYKYEQLEKVYMELMIFSLPKTFDIYSITGTKNDLIQKASLYSSFRISLLTIVIGPEFHNLRLISPFKKNEHLGRVMYIITCKQIANIRSMNETTKTTDKKGSNYLANIKISTNLNCSILVTDQSVSYIPLSIPNIQHIFSLMKEEEKLVKINSDSLITMERNKETETIKLTIASHIDKIQTVECKFNASTGEFTEK